MTQRQNILEMTPRARRAYAKRIASKLVGESPLRRKKTKEVLAESTAALKLQLETLTEKQAEGTLKAEEARTMPALASQMLRNLTSLGVTTLDDVDDDEEL